MVPIMTEAMDKPKETNSDTGYEASCVISASSSSQITKVKHSLVECRSNIYT